MEGGMKKLLRKTPFWRPLRIVKGYIALALMLITPDRVGRPATWLYKIFTIRKYARRFHIDIFIETGTNVGETLAGVRAAFRELHSVELGDALYQKARDRFVRYSSVHIHHGESAAFLRELAPKLSRPAIYWLDAHYSENNTARGEKDSPIVDELAICLGNWRTGSVILIDDARYFDGRHASYPTVVEIEAMVKRYREGLRCVVKRDLIRIC